MTDDERRPDEEKAAELERELGDMDERREQLGEQIDSASDQWERKKKDERVPGATGEEGDDEDEGSDDADELDFGRDIDSADVVGEASSRDDDES